MKKFWMILSLMLGLTGCEEANEIFGYDEYGYSGISDDIQIGEECYPGPVYLDATSWGTIAYVNDKYVNKSIKLLMSEVENAEGGREIDVTSNLIAINDLSAGIRYYYCLCMPEGGIKSEIKSFVVPDVSTLYLEIVPWGGFVSCFINDSINSAFILEKGFRFRFGDNVYKHTTEGDEFIVSSSDIIKKYPFVNRLYVDAYVQTPNAFHRSPTISLDTDWFNAGINKDDITITKVFEEVIDDVDYIGCTVWGYVDSVYFYKGGNDEPNKRIYPDKIKEDGSYTTTFYIKKGFYRNIRLRAFYKIDDENDLIYVKESESYTPTQKIRNLSEFLEFVRIEDASSSDDVVHVSLLTDITLPSDMRLSINLSGIILDGNGHTLDGVSYFPLFHNLWQTDLSQSKVRNLKIGTDETVYVIKEGTSSLSTTDNKTPRFFLSNDNASLPFYHTDNEWGLPVISQGNNSMTITFNNCEIRGTFKVYDVSSFYLYYFGLMHNDYCNEISGLENYAKFEYITTVND